MSKHRLDGLFVPDYRPTTEQETVPDGEGWFVFRVINRLVLERAARSP